MIRTAVKIAYLGNDYSGSQIQPDHRTVEGDILSDLKIIMKIPSEEIDLKLASRTDKGVNALGNVAVFNSVIMDLDILLKALNAVSKNVFYRSIAIVNNDFNPRYADVRRYRYVLPARDKDVLLMKECAKLFVGEHDFKRFCRSEGKPTVAKIDSIDILVENDVIVMDFSARYYLWNQIRRITSAIASVGMGDCELSDVKDALEGKDVTFGLARPDGLTLTDVHYNNVEFTVPSADMFDNRIEEEMFMLRLKTLFFTSL